MNLKKILTVMLCGAMLVGFVACENEEPEVNNNGNGTEQTKPSDGNGDNGAGDETPVSVLNNGHEYVDLGLPSGLLWASCNVGATASEEAGNYFSWGEIEQDSNFNWGAYQWSGTSYSSMTKYCNNAEFGLDGFTDNKVVLDAEDDAAHALMGGDWRMPTKAEFDELLAECTWEWATVNEINGYKVSSKVEGNENYIFLPAVGYQSYDIQYYNERGAYWSASLDENEAYQAHYLFFDATVCKSAKKNRYCGYTVRAVIQEVAK